MEITSLYPIWKASSLICGFSAIATLTFYLGTDFQHCLWFAEPNPWIKIPELVWGVSSISFYVYELSKRITWKKENQKSASVVKEV